MARGIGVLCAFAAGLDQPKDVFEPIYPTIARSARARVEAWRGGG